MTEDEIEEVALVLADSMDELRSELANQRTELADLKRDLAFALDEITYLKSSRVPLGPSARLPTPKPPPPVTDWWKDNGE